MVKLVIFDLDGTLIDSRRDLAASINCMRRSFGLPEWELAAVTVCIGDGMKNLVCRTLTDADVDENEALQRMKAFYAEHLVDTTCLYDGVADTLRKLREHGVKLAVVTNKPVAATEVILQKLGVFDLFDDIIGGDSGFPLKPEPESLLSLISKYGFVPEQCRMVGDHYTDLESGRKAGIKRILCKYGFGDPKSEMPDHCVDSFPEIADKLEF